MKQTHANLAGPSASSHPDHSIEVGGFGGFCIFFFLENVVLEEFDSPDIR